MKATDLRIGNLVYNKWVENGETQHKEERAVSGYDIECLEIDGHFYQEGEAEPIPLTEEWLKKFGLKRNSDGSIFSFIETQQIGDDLTIRNDIQEWSLWFGDAMMIDIKIEYVHQLQNLYFALTGEELIKNAI